MISSEPGLIPSLALLFSILSPVFGSTWDKVVPAAPGPHLFRFKFNRKVS